MLTVRLPLAMSCLVSACLMAAGCGTTRWTDSTRTATEQLLISDAIEQSVSRIDFQKLAGQTVYLDTTYMGGVVDKDYLISTLRQHMLASGCTMKDKRDQADFIVEARAGTVGTDRHDLLFGIPSINLPWTPVTGGPAALPEVAVARRTNQKGVAKVAVFAYHRATGQPVWQSGVDAASSTAQNSWWMGVGPVQRGTIYDKAQFAGNPLFGKPQADEPRAARVTRETSFNDAQRLVARSNSDPDKVARSIRMAATGGPTPLPAVSPPVPGNSSGENMIAPVPAAGAPNSAGDLWGTDARWRSIEWGADEATLPAPAATSNPDLPGPTLR
jgi:hypothetical protein